MTPRSPGGRLPDPRRLGRNLPAPTARADVVELGSVPGLGGLYGRGVVGSVTAALARRRTVRPADLPTTRLVVRGVQAEAEHLGAYQQLLGEPASDALPAGFVHVLAFPVATALMVRPDFPLPLLGMVHLANRVEQRRPARLGEALDIHVHAENLRAHRAGVSVDLLAEVATAGATATPITPPDDPDILWRGTSTYLAKGFRLAGADRDGSAATVREEFVPPVPTGQWRLDAGVGRRYAAISGDRNPIHLSALAAKAFGFPRTIAHGMYTASRALADVGPRARGDAFVWAVEFATPVLLPSTVAVRAAPADRRDPATGYELTAWDPRRSKPYLTGSVTPL